MWELQGRGSLAILIHSWTIQYRLEVITKHSQASPTLQSVSRNAIRPMLVSIVRSDSRNATGVLIFKTMILAGGNVAHVRLGVQIA